MKSFLGFSFSGVATRAAALVFVVFAVFVVTIGVCASTSFALESDTLQVHYLEGIVVVANSEATPVSEVGSSVTIVTSEEIKSLQKQTVAEVLRSVPGLDVVQSGSRGGQTSVFMRGANSGHTLVLVDGIEMNDPSSPNGAFDFADLSVDNIERIEVLRGSQSILYGSDAIGGVISIITHQGRGAAKTTLSANYGAFSTARLSARTSGSNLRTSYSFSASRSDSKGFSSTDSRVVNERDGYGLTSLSGKVVVRPSEYSQLRLVVRSSESEVDLDKGFSSFSNAGVFDDLNMVQDSRKSYAKVEGEISSDDAKTRVKAFATLSRNKRGTFDAPDAAFGSGAESTEFDSESSRFGFKGIIAPFAKQKIIVGVETERDLLSQVTDYGFGISALDGLNARTTGVYGLAQVNVADRLFATVGVREDDHDRFGKHRSFRYTASFVISETNTRLRGSFGDGFSAPSLYQLFDPLYGDTTLVPEVSESWDVGFEQEFADGSVSFGATWFHQSIKNIFGFDPNTFATINIASARSEGAEIFAQLRSNEFSARVDYTYTDAIDKADGSSLLRRAKNKVSARVDYAFDQFNTAGLSVRHVGSRADNDFEVFPSERVELAGYTVVGVTAQRRVFEGVTVTGRVDNVFDEKYEDVLYYSTSGRALSFGVRYSL